MICLGRTPNSDTVKNVQKKRKKTETSKKKLEKFNEISKKCFKKLKVFQTCPTLRRPQGCPTTC